MSDLRERLEALDAAIYDLASDDPADTLMCEARNLAASSVDEVERLRAALREIVDEDARPCPAGRCCVPSFGGGECWSCIARRALEGGE